MPDVLDVLLWPARVALELADRVLLETRYLGRCPVCNTSVLSDDPHVRTRAGVFHADPCAQYRRRPVKRRRSRSYRLPVRGDCR